jgi:uncharacterized protein YhfF
MDHLEQLPRVEFAFPGPLRDRLVSAILDGTKTSTTSTAIEYRIEVEPFPQVGVQQVLVDSAGTPVAVIETTHVDHVPLAGVPWEHARDEGEGYSSVAEWRSGHERFWHGADMREFLGDSSFMVSDETMVVLERFRVIRLL